MMKGTDMRNKIIFLLIFVFSFIIMHDTVLDNMKSDHSNSLVQISDSDVGKKEYHSLHHLHNMFHFLAVMESEYLLCEPTETEVLIATPLLAYLYADKEQDERPPIV